MVMRWWRNLKMLKRAGRGHIDGDPDSTPDGGLAVACLACPQPNCNLPPGWESAPRDTR